jgi:hypothetical protein
MDNPFSDRYAISETGSAVELDLNMAKRDTMGSTTALYPASEAAASTPSPARAKLSKKPSGGLAPASSLTKENIRKLTAPFRRGKAKDKTKARGWTVPFLPRNKPEKVLGERVPDGYNTHQRRHVRELPLAENRGSR